MACEEVQEWSFGGLIAAYVDLAIAYLLLCLSSVAFFISKFLGFVGLSLPCTCDGLFFTTHYQHNKNKMCLNRLLIETPTQIVSDVQSSVKHKFPFSNKGFVERVVESGCSSSSNVIKKVEKKCDDEEEEDDVRGKGKRVVLRRRQRSGRLRQRYSTGGVDDDGGYSSVSSTNISGPLVVDDYGEDARYLEYNKKSPTLRELRQRSLASLQMNYYPEEEDTHIKKNLPPSNDEPQYNPKVVQSFSEDEKNTVRILEQALEEEQIARAALYLDLEKERSAAATAADEAMAMILRLQEEKASIGMEARQYQRIFEEKSTYDAEEMDILKEILVRRETEINFLEKEVEAYKKMLSVENEEFGVSVDPNDDPVQILHQLIASTDKKDEKLDLQNHDDSDEKLQEKEMISVDSNTSKDPQENQFLEIEGIELEQTEETNLGAQKIIETCNQTDLMIDKDASVYDVHVIGDGTNFCKGDDLSASTSSIETEVDGKRSSSEITSRLPPKGPRGLRRNSTSALDSEMLKIDSEVGRLLARLKLVQEGREKLSIPLENRERENAQLKLLEDIARQVQEIRYLTVPGKALRQGFSKKRRCRSVSSGFRL